jgi:hypothetical protein
MEPEDRPTLRRLWLRIGGTLVGLALLYVLSIGPAVFCAEKYGQRENVDPFWMVEKVYRPLLYMPDGPWTTALLLYVQWWMSLAGEDSLR